MGGIIRLGDVEKMARFLPADRRGRARLSREYKRARAHNTLPARCKQHRAQHS